MATDTSISDSGDPLAGLSGPLLFPRTVRALAAGPVPASFKDLESVHNFVKSMKDSRSPEKLMDEAKRIVDGGAEILESDLVNFAANVGITDAIAAKGKDRPQERRQGLGLARKRAHFSLKTSASQPSMNLEPTVDIDQLEDPDEFFDAYERMEKAKKEIQRELGGSSDNFNQYKPSTNARRRRPGILGKSRSYKHRYSLEVSGNNDIFRPSQESIDEGVPSELKDNSQENMVNLDRGPDHDHLEDAELAEPVEKTEIGVNNLLDELLSFSTEDLDGDGALNLLQERLKIKPLDKENLYAPELGRTSISAMEESWQRSRRSSVVIDNVLKSINKKQRTEHEQMANPVNSVSSPTPPRSPYASLTLLKKRILQSNPLRDPFSPVNIDSSATQNISPIHPLDKLHEPAISNMDADIEADITEPTVSNMDAKANFTEPTISNMGVHVEADVMEPTVPNGDASVEADITATVPNVDANVESDFTEPTTSKKDEQKVIGNSDSPVEQLVDEDVSIQIANAGGRVNERLERNLEEIMNLNDNQSNSPVEDEASADPPSRQEMDPDQQPEVRKTKPQREKGEVGEKRVRKLHPMRKSLAEAGTSFDNGVRRSKRVKMRPLEYWKGERFLYERMDDSLKLLGVKYISPGKGTDNLKVKPYIFSESPKYKELLEMAARY